MTSCHLERMSFDVLFSWIYNFIKLFLAEKWGWGAGEGVWDEGGVQSQDLLLWRLCFWAVALSVPRKVANYLVSVTVKPVGSQVKNQRLCGYLHQWFGRHWDFKVFVVLGGCFAWWNLVYTGVVQGHLGVHHGQPRCLQGFLEDLCGVPCFFQTFWRAQIKAQNPTLQQGFQFPL